jgi:hypothetical protein
MLPWNGVYVSASRMPSSTVLAETSQHCQMKLNGSSWETVGDTGFSDTRADDFSMIIGPGNAPFVALYGHNAKASALKFDAASGTWAAASGSRYVSQGVGYVTSLISANDVPYMVFCDYSKLYYATKVQKYTATGWDAVGPELSVDLPTYMPIALDSKNDVYICWSDINDKKNRQSRSSTALARHGRRSAPRTSPPVPSPISGSSSTETTYPSSHSPTTRTAARPP